MDDLVEYFRSRAEDNKRKAELHEMGSDELYAFYQGVAIGRERSANDLVEE